MAAAGEFRSIRTHQLRVEEDVVFLVLSGDFTLSDAQQVNAAIEAVLLQLGRVFVLVDQTHAGKTTPEARRCFAEWNRQHRPSGSVLFGGSVAARAVASLVVAAIRLFRADSAPTVFTASQGEARAWIAAQRSQLRT